MLVRSLSVRSAGTALLPLVLVEAVSRCSAWAPPAVGYECGRNRKRQLGPHP